MVQRITLYSKKHTPFAHRVQLALEEVGAEYTLFNLDGMPEWYTSQVNPAALVPAVAYGGPDVPPDQPSPESTKIVESPVILEFIADLFPASGLLPADPVDRAKVRLIMDSFKIRLHPALVGLLRDPGALVDPFYQGIDAIQDMISDSGKYAVGDTFTIADIALAGFLPRIEVIFAHDLGHQPVGVTAKISEVLQNDPKYVKYRRYLSALKERECVKKTFNESDYLAFAAVTYVRAG